jgi:poly(3-hydroxybutyrate) depolymerase
MRLIEPATLVMVAIMIFGIDGQAADTPEAKRALRTAEGNGVEYYLSLPKSWTPDSTWPILVTIDGSGHDFQGNFKSFVHARGERPFIIVTPCVSSNGREPKDLQAVLAIVKEVQESSKGQQKFFITGFSAGGHLAWQCIFNHPELLAGAAPAAANFRFRGITDASKASERVKLPIHGFLGEKDAYKQFLDPQWVDAAKFARENGYENLTFTEVPGASHEAFADRVVTFFASLLPKQRD